MRDELLTKQIKLLCRDLFRMPRHQPLDRRSARQLLADAIACAWADVVGPMVARKTRVVDCRGGELLVDVANDALRGKLAGDQALVEKLRGRLPVIELRAVRFKVGP